MVEAVASEEPQTAPKPAQAAIADIATPPRSQPSQAFAARNRSFDSPARDAMLPIRTNIGSTDRSYIENCEYVITSYSIHYTKLYDKLLNLK